MYRGTFLPVALLFTIAGQLSAQCPDGAPPPCRQAAAPARAFAPAPTSVAVLPLQNRSPDPSDAYLAEGMTDEIANRLTQVGRLQVKARGLVAAQWRRTPEAFEAARRLNVAWFVSGHVRRAGPQLVVNVELVRATTGEEVWATRFPRGVSDVFAVQAEVAESVAVVVGGRLSPGERRTLVRRPTTSNEAYRLYLYGNSLLKRRTATDMQQALDAYATAVRLDSSFGAAWSRVAMARALQASWGWSKPLSKDSLLALATIAGRRALSLDTLSPDVWTAWGAVMAETGDLGAAEVAYARSLRLDSLNPDAWHFRAMVHGTDRLQDPSRAEPWLRRALALDPALRNTWRHLALVKRNQGDMAMAEALLDTTLAQGAWGPAHFDRGYVRFLRGNGIGALADLAESDRLNATVDTTSRAVFGIAAGDSTTARAELARLRALADTSALLQGGVARLAAGLGLRAEALTALERYRSLPANPNDARCACSSSLGTWAFLHDPIFAPLRTEPRFVRLMDDTRPRIR